MPTSDPFQFKHFVFKCVAIWLHNFTCALHSCGEPADHVHPIDGDPDNIELTNLLPLCFPCYKVYSHTYAPYKLGKKMIISKMLSQITKLTMK